MTTHRTSFPTDAADLLQLVMDNIPQFIFWKDRESVYLGCNRNFARAAGVESPEAIVGKTDFQLAWRNEEAEFFREVDRRVMESATPEYHIVEPQLQADGKQAWLDTNKIPLLDPDGHVVGILGTFEDITERIKAENAVRESEDNLRTLLDSLAEGVIATDANGCVTRMNPAACALTGCSPEQVLGRPLREVYRATGPNGELRDPFAHVMRSRSAQACDVELRGGCDDAQDARLLVETAAPMGDGSDPQGIVVVVRDVTDQRRVEDHLRHVQRMESIGQLAGGVAHDFNNLLTGVVGTAEMLREQLAGRRDLERMADLILETSNRAADLTQKLLAFSRRGRLQSRPVDLHGLIDDVVAIVQRSVDRSIGIEVRKGATCAWVNGDPSELQTALLNLALNARDAMPEGGRLTFRTHNVALDEAACRASASDLRPGRYLCLEVQDTGSGMTPQLQARIFEPFFTTKPTGKGTGLGLAAVYGVVLEHHGSIEVHSDVGEGTQFRVLLACVEQPVEQGPHAGEHGVAVSPAGTTVLLVDDEDVVRESTEMLLASLGYQVITACDGVEALEIYRKAPDRIGLVLLDMVMPRMGGKRCLEALRAFDPDVRVLLSSGFTTQTVSLGMGTLAPDGFLSKPYRREELAKAVRKALS